MSNTAIRNCTFGYQCDKSWNDLIDTKELTVKHCDKCDKNVFYCASPVELKEAIMTNKCVAVDLVKEEKIVRLMGYPSFEDEPSTNNKPANNSSNGVSYFDSLDDEIPF